MVFETITDKFKQSLISTFGRLATEDHPLWSDALMGRSSGSGFFPVLSLEFVLESGIFAVVDPFLKTIIKISVYCVIPAILSGSTPPHPPQNCWWRFGPIGHERSCDNSIFMNTENNPHTTQEFWWRPYPTGRSLMITASFLDWCLKPIKPLIINYNIAFIAAQRAKHQVIFWLTREKSRYAWLCRLQLYPLRIACLQP